VSRKLRGIKSAERDSTWQKERDGDRERGATKRKRREVRQGKLKMTFYVAASGLFRCQHKNKNKIQIK